MSAKTSSKGAVSSSGYVIYLMPGMIGFALIVLLPFLMNIAISFTQWRGVGAPRFVGFANYELLLQDGLFWVAFDHSFAFIIAMAVVPTALGLFLAALLFDYIAERFGERASSFFRAGFYLPQILPIAVAGVLWGWILSPIGVLNAALKSVGLDFLAQNWLGDPKTALFSVMFVMVWLQLGYSLVVFMSGLSRVDPSLYEAAELDGASWLQRFRHITIAMLKPEIFVVGLTTTIAALKVFAPVYVLTQGGPNNATTVPSYFAYYHFFTTSRVGYGAAITTVQTLITVVLVYFFLRLQTGQINEAN